MKTPKAATPRKPKASVKDITAVLHVLLSNRTRYVHRDEIAEITAINERIVRDAISAIVESQLAPVLPDREGGGYRISTDAEMILTEVRRLESHIANTLARIAALRAMAVDPSSAGALAVVPNLPQMAG